MMVDIRKSLTEFCETYNRMNPTLEPLSVDFSKHSVAGVENTNSPYDGKSMYTDFVSKSIYTFMAFRGTKILYTYKAEFKTSLPEGYEEVAFLTKFLNQLTTELVIKSLFHQCSETKE